MCPRASPHLSLSPAVTSEQIEQLHRRFKQLSHNRKTIRYGLCAGGVGLQGRGRRRKAAPIPEPTHILEHRADLLMRWGHKPRPL